MKILFLFIFHLTVSAAFVHAGPMQMQIIQCSDNGKGMLCRYQNKNIIFLEGSPTEIGTAHGELRRKEIKGMSEIVLLVAAGYLLRKDDWFFSRIDEVMRRTAPFVPKRFYEECDAMSVAAGITAKEGRHINFFPEMFHCTGVAVRGKASIDGQVIHARVLDYMSAIGLQRYAQLMVFMPQGYNTWISQSYAGFIGTVTAMNDKGLAIGEMGGNGEGKWDGLPMSFMMRRVMEECANVEEALALMQSVPLTCDYYYVLSDKQNNMAAVKAISGKKILILRPGEQTPGLPPIPEDTVFVSADERAKALSRRLQENFGKIDVDTMIKIIKRPVAMKSNLHNMIFLPKIGVMYFSDATKKSLACDQPYVRVSSQELIDFYRSNKGGTESPGQIESGR